MKRMASLIVLSCIFFISLILGCDTGNSNISNGPLGLQKSPWPKFRRDIQSNGLSPTDTSTTTGTLKWSFQTNGGIATSPAISADGTIYVGSHDGNLYAIH